MSEFRKPEIQTTKEKSEDPTPDSWNSLSESFYQSDFVNKPVVEPNQETNKSLLALEKSVKGTSFSSTEQSEFILQGKQFVENARSRQVSENQIVGCLNEVNRLVLSTEQSVVTDQQKLQLGQLILKHAANPGTVDQGYHATCQATALGEMLYTRFPGQAAEIIVTAALKGAWTAPDGKAIALDPESLKPGKEEANYPPLERQRGFDMQLMNLVVLNDINQRKTPPLFYLQKTPEYEGDTGERLLKADGSFVLNEDGTIDNYPHASCKAILHFGTRLTGETGFVIRAAHYMSDSPSLEGLVNVYNPEQLEASLQTMKSENRLPMLALGDMFHPDLIDLQVKNGRKPYSEPQPLLEHIFSLADYQPDTGMVLLSDQRGRVCDVWIDTETLYRVMSLQGSLYPKSSLVQRVDLHCKNKFPDEAEKNWRDLYQKCLLSGDKNSTDKSENPALSSQEKEELAAAADPISRREFPDDSYCRQLAKKEWLYYFAGGKALTVMEGANLSSKRQFPNDTDKYYREICKKNLLLLSGMKVSFTAADKAALVSKQEFSSDSDIHYRNLAQKQILAKSSLGPELSPQEQAALFSKRLYPYEDAEPYRVLREKELLNLYGCGPALTEQEKAKFANAASVVAYSEFPNTADLRYRILARREWLNRYGQGTALAPAELDLLKTKRQK